MHKKLGYQFNNQELLQEALTHPSLAGAKSTQKVRHYERFEFLGDSVLGLVISEYLVAAYPLEKEGALAVRKAALVSRELLARIASDIDLGDEILMTDSEEQNGGRKNFSNLGNSLEAIIGAIFLDGGLDEAKKFILYHWNRHFDEMVTPPKDPKTTLQEIAQSKKLTRPEYKVIKQEGRGHELVFTVEVAFDSKAATGEGKNIKLAEKSAAIELLKLINY